MKKMSKKLIALTLLSIIGTTNLYAAVPHESVKSIQQNETHKKSVSDGFVDEHVVNLLRKNNVDFVIENGNQIKITNPNQQIIASLNIELENNLMMRATYPTSWTHMKAYDLSISKRFKQATQSAFITALTAWLGDTTSKARVLAGAASGVYLTYYFVDDDTEDIYYHTKYSYREVGPGRFDAMGNFLGDYEIKKEERTTKNSTNSGGQLTTTTKSSTILDRWF